MTLIGQAALSDSRSRVSMLTLTRKNNQSIIISPSTDLDPDMKVSELFEQSNIEICFSKIRQGTVSVSIDAPRALDLVRSELLD
jgi:sRNA-binding carbon storage regulator CsrA